MYVHSFKNFDKYTVADDYKLPLITNVTLSNVIYNIVGMLIKKNTY